MEKHTQKKIERLFTEKGPKTYKDNGFVKDKKTNQLKNGFHRLKSGEIICLKDIGLDHDGNDLPLEKPNNQDVVDPETVTGQESK